MLRLRRASHLASMRPACTAEAVAPMQNKEHAGHGACNLYLACVLTCCLDWSLQQYLLLKRLCNTSGWKDRQHVLCITSCCRPVHRFLHFCLLHLLSWTYSSGAFSEGHLHTGAWHFMVSDSADIYCGTSKACFRMYVVIFYTQGSCSTD